MSRLKVGLALGGGGARGYAHLGIIEALRSHNIPIDIIAGTSMGGVIGGAYACEVDLVRLEQLLNSLDLYKLLNFPRTSLMGLMGNTATEYLFKNKNWRSGDVEVTKDAIEFFNLFTQRRRFEDLRTPFGIVAVDVDSGDEVYLREGLISRAIAAGIAIPGIHYPVRINDNYLVDGGLISKVPITLAFEMGADVVIGVDVSLPSLRGGGVTSIEVLIQAEAIMLRELNRAKLDLLKHRHRDRVLIVEPDVDDIKTFALKDIQTPKDRGMEAIERRIDEIRALVSASE